MKPLRSHQQEFIKRIRAARRVVLMFDFDGTLSPIVRRPERAALPAHTKDLIAKLARRVPVAIVSGRNLPWLEERVGIPGIVYAGNHGSEWKIAERYGSRKLPRKATLALDAAHEALKFLEVRYRGSMVRHKTFSLVVHYRIVATHRAPALERDVAAVIRSLPARNVLRAFKGKKVYEVQARAGWTKGDFVTYLMKMFAKNDPSVLPVFVGDDATDEDAFRALKKGLTIRIGKAPRSAARYYIERQGEVRSLLRTLLRIL